jgi:hypothetical protein
MAAPVGAAGSRDNREPLSPSAGGSCDLSTTSTGAQRYVDEVAKSSTYCGRILNLLFLVEQGLLDQPVLYLSRAIIRRRSEYYRLLNAVTRDDAWEPWVLYTLDAVHNTTIRTTKKIKAIRELLGRATAHVREHAPSLYSRELVELVFEQPYSRIANVVDAGIAKRQTATYRSPSRSGGPKKRSRMVGISLARFLGNITGLYTGPPNIQNAPLKTDNCCTTHVDASRECVLG